MYSGYDLFCGKGGCSVGYDRAGIQMTGIDCKPKSTYPYSYIRKDVRWFLHDWRRLEGVDFVHASPPCQEFTSLRNFDNGQGYNPSYVNLIPWTRDTLSEWAEQTGGVYIIENVPGAPVRNDVTLCGSQFGLSHAGYQLRRHRLFESNIKLRRNGCRHKRPTWGVYGSMKDKLPGGSQTPNTLEEAQALMGIDWMSWNDLTQAIPPAYTQFLGEQVVGVLDGLVACELEAVS